MTLQLDPRQRAMLADMGVRVWAPQTMPEQPVSAPAFMRSEVVGETAFASTNLVSVKPSSLAATTVARAAPSPTKPADMQPPELSLSPLPEGLAQMDWAGLQAAAASCQACGLCQGRHHSLFASGSVVQPPADWLIVGDAPTDAEDLAGVALVGEEGLLFDAMLQAMGLSRAVGGPSTASVVITSAVKCHPQDKRNPSAAEWTQCNAYLQRQIELLQPKVILALGRLAAQALLQPSLGELATQPLGKLRGQVHQASGCPVVVSYHPAYLLRSPSDKAKAWADLMLAMQQVRPVSP
jgi:DNA polymerase